MRSNLHNIVSKQDLLCNQSPGSRNAHFGWAMALNRGHNSTNKTSKREKKERNLRREWGKKREMLGLPPSRPPPSGPPSRPNLFLGLRPPLPSPSGSHRPGLHPPPLPAPRPLGPHFFWVWAPTFLFFHFFVLFLFLFLFIFLVFFLFFFLIFVFFTCFFLFFIIFHLFSTFFAFSSPKPQTSFQFGGGGDYLPSKPQTSSGFRGGGGSNYLLFPSPQTQTPHLQTGVGGSMHLLLLTHLRLSLAELLVRCSFSWRAWRPISVSSFDRSKGKETRDGFQFVGSILLA